MNEKYFFINEKYFSVKEKFGLVFTKVFLFFTVFVFLKIVSRKSLSKLSYVYLLLKKLLTENTFQSKKNLVWFSVKCFPEKFRRNTFRKL